MNNLVLLGGILGLYLFYPLCKSILKKECTQNPLTFFLWSALDGISAVATFLEGGNYLQATLFCVGGLITMSCTLIAGNKLKWTKFESMVTGLVIVCIAVWMKTDNTTAALASILALCIASVPQIKDTWAKPADTPTLVYFGYVMSNALATFGGKEISVIEIGYPLSGMLVCLAIYSFSLRKNMVTVENK
jgi:hypothetical protein